MGCHVLAGASDFALLFLACISHFEHQCYVGDKDVGAQGCCYRFRVGSRPARLLLVSSLSGELPEKASNDPDCSRYVRSACQSVRLAV